MNILIFLWKNGPQLLTRYLFDKQNNIVIADCFKLFHENTISQK